MGRKQEKKEKGKRALLVSLACMSSTMIPTF